jgi:hypothetical protein
MTLFEIAGAAMLGAIGGLVATRITHRILTPGLVSVEAASKQINTAVRDAFEAGMLCAADIVTHDGQEELAGRIRQTVQYARATNDN